MGAFLKFNKGILRMPFPWQLWTLLLVSLNLVLPLFFLGRLEAQLTLVAIAVSMLLMTGLTAVSGFSRLVGLGHIVWVPLVAFLATRLSETPANDIYGVWLRVLLVANSLSLVIDFLDVLRYVAGDRKETVGDL
jgi:hypothetical protein